MRDVETVLRNVITDSDERSDNLSSEAAAPLSFIKLDSEFQLIVTPCGHNFTVLILPHCVVSATVGCCFQRRSSEKPH